MRIILFIFCFITFVACSSDPVPANVLKPEKMQKVVSELIQVDEFMTNFVIKDSSIDVKKKRSILYEQTFRVNGITKNEFYKSYRYYQERPDLQKALFDTINNRANRMKVNAGRVNL